MQTLQDRRTHILQVIAALQQEALIQSIENFLQTLLQNNKALLYAKPLSPTLNLNAIIHSQNYQTANVVTLFGALEDDEPFGNLLNDLSL
jgi:hypothetical protein